MNEWWVDQNFFFEYVTIWSFIHSFICFKNLLFFIFKWNEKICLIILIFFFFFCGCRCCCCCYCHCQWPALSLSLLLVNLFFLFWIKLNWILLIDLILIPFCCCCCCSNFIFFQIKHKKKHFDDIKIKSEKRNQWLINEMWNRIAFRTHIINVDDDMMAISDKKRLLR